jgi:hypothetical protein
MRRPAPALAIVLAVDVSAFLDRVDQVIRLHASEAAAFDMGTIEQVLG